MNKPDIKIFAENVEQGALDDIEALANCPVNSGKKLRFMPDCHKGVTVPIGTSIPIDLDNPNEAINPGTVGCDIGCTVSATFFDAPMLPEKMTLFEHRIRRDIPFGFDINDKSDYDRNELYKRINSNMDKLVSAHPSFKDFAVRVYCDEDMAKWCHRIEIKEKMFFDSLPSVGGGNHFVEYDENPELGKYAVLVHCGSRNLGQKVFRYHKTIADLVKVSKTEHDMIVAKVKAKNADPHFLRDEIDAEVRRVQSTRIPGYLKGDALKMYVVDVLVAQTYAAFNHDLIHRKISQIYRKLCKAREVDHISSTHNYIDYDFEALDGTPHMMIRKGAIRSYLGERMIIPFNMRDGVAICSGKSNSDWNFTAPHGAGRVMSRAKAFETLDVESFKKEMNDAGIYTTTANSDTLDEAPEAYKSMDDIVRLIEPTAEVLFLLKPKMNIKAAEGRKTHKKSEQAG